MGPSPVRSVRLITHCHSWVPGPWFSVEAKNEERGVSGVSYLKKLYVTVNGVTVTMMKARRMLVS